MLFITKKPSLEEIESLDEEKILIRLERCLGKLSEHDAYELKRSYSDEWHRLITTHKKKTVGPVGILEEYCRLHEDHPELNIDQPIKFSKEFINFSFKISLLLLNNYYKRCQEGLRKICVGVEEESLNNEELYQGINNIFYEVPKGWLLF